MIDLVGPLLEPEEEELISHPEVGGVILFARNYRNRHQLELLVRNIRKLRPGMLLAVDQEGGRVQRFHEEFHRLPPLQSLGDMARREPGLATGMARAIAWLMATDLIRSGLDISFAPVLDLDRRRSRVIGDRAFDDQPDLVTVLGRAYIQGMHMAGMAATGKHFPGHGGVEADSHLELPRDERGLAAIWERDLKPFRELAGELDALMSAHILFPQVDEQLVSYSPFWLEEVLRQRIGFRGLVFSDDLHMEGASSAGAYPQRARRALEAGCDMLILCNNRPAVLEVIEWMSGQSGLSPLDLSSLRARRSWDEERIRDHPWYDEAIQYLDELRGEDS